MNQQDYRSYMDRVCLDEAQHGHLMDALRAAPGRAHRGGRIAYYAVAAACLALLCAGGLWLFHSASGAGDPTLSAATGTLSPTGTPPLVTAAPAPTPTPAPEGEAYLLRPQDPFQGQVHGNFSIQGVEFDSDALELSTCVAYPKGWFQVPLTREDMVYLLAGEGASDAPWSLYWNGYAVSGRAIYDGEGRLWQVDLYGVRDENQLDTFTLTVSPGGEPQDGFSSALAPTLLHGVQVQGAGPWSSDLGGVTAWRYVFTLEGADAGLCFKTEHTDRDAAAQLAVCAANVFARSSGVYLDRLSTYKGQVPQWRSESLTLQQALAEEGYALHVSAIASCIPDDFSFESACRDLGEDTPGVRRDTLSLSWTGYYTNIFVTLSRSDGEVEIMDVSDRAYYDRRLYTVPYADSVPDEVMFGGFQDPVFRSSDLSLDLMESRILPSAEGCSESMSMPYDVNRAIMGGNFRVLYSDGVLASYDFKGITPEEALALVCRPEPEAEPTQDPVSVTFDPDASVWTWGDSDTCPVADCSESSEHIHLCLVPAGACQAEGCTQTGEHTHQLTVCMGGDGHDGHHGEHGGEHGGFSLSGLAPCAVSGCGESGLHLHGEVCYYGHTAASGHHSDTHHSAGHH